ncbi:MAG: BlaI/MecI/CopY family transcriptional regulator [Anaerolineales bacterium]
MPPQVFRKLKEETPHGLEKFLGELELATMEVVWARGPMSVREVLETLNQKGRNLAYTTVMTILYRLKEKGWLAAEKKGKAFCYQAVRSREEAEAAAIGGVMRSLLKDFGELAVVQFVRELDELDPAQLHRLAELAQQADEERNE